MNPEYGSCEPHFTILMAEDDPDDQFLMDQALKDIQYTGQLRFVQDGEDLMDYLHHRGRYAEPMHSPRPSLIFLDLNMPKKDGRQALREIKSTADLHTIPVIVWTTSGLEEDRTQSVHTGADAYVTKPIGYTALVRTVGDIMGTYCRGKSGSAKR